MLKTKKEEKEEKVIECGDVTSAFLTYTSSQQVFTLRTLKRDYEFEALSKQDCEIWIRVLNIVVAMNKFDVKCENKNLFVFEAQQQLLG